MKPIRKTCEMATKELAQYVNRSVLKPEFTEEDIIALTKDGVGLGCTTIYTNPGYMDLCKPYVKGNKTMLCPIYGFPFGMSPTESRVKQTEITAKYDTIEEVDVVANFGPIRSGRFDEAMKDLKACVDVTHKYGREIKVIFETDALNEEQVRKACKCCTDAGANFVKASTRSFTGFESHGATPRIIEIMMEEVDGKYKVRGSGCICTREHFLQLIDMGIDRVGVGYKSVSVALGLDNKVSTDNYQYRTRSEKYSKEANRDASFFTVEILSAVRYRKAVW